MFYGCQNVETLVLPKNLQFIRNDALSITYLKDEMIILPSTVERIEEYGICLNGGSIFVPKTVKVMGKYAISQCDVYLESAEMPKEWHKGCLAEANSTVWGYQLK